MTSGSCHPRGRIRDVLALSTALDAMEIADNNDTSPDIKPDVLKEENWEEWSLEFPTYLSNVMGKQKVAIDYVIRPDVAPGHVFTTAREQEM